MIPNKSTISSGVLALDSQAFLKSMTTAALPFNTAVFYDIENLLCGYNFSSRFAADLSLKEIFSDIVDTGLCGRIAVQRAYANWSDPRLGILRNEINELGIAPVQVFGFSRDAKKNAADIQLAIDAVDLAHSRSAIETFVIVSGDGGFAALAKKLHEYGKSVIGCAYRKATNQTFQAVCDAFVWIEPPDEDDDESKPRAVDRAVRTSVAKPQASGSGFAGTVLQEEVIAKIGRVVMPTDRPQLRKVIHTLMDRISSVTFFRRQLERDGLLLTVVGQVIRECIPEFETTMFGFPKMTEMMQYGCTQSKWQVCKRNADGILCILPRARKDLGDVASALGDLEDSDLHSEMFYTSILRHGTPSIRFPSEGEFEPVLEYLCKEVPSHVPVAELIESAAMALGERVQAGSIKQSILTLVSCGAFERSPEESMLADQKLSLRSSFDHPKALLDLVRTQAHEKIARMLGDAKDEILDGLL